MGGGLNPLTPPSGYATVIIMFVSVTAKDHAHCRTALRPARTLLRVSDLRPIKFRWLLKNFHRKRSQRGYARFTDFDNARRRKGGGADSENAGSAQFSVNLFSPTQPNPTQSAAPQPRTTLVQLIH